MEYLPKLLARKFKWLSDFSILTLWLMCIGAAIILPVLAGFLVKIDGYWALDTSPIKYNGIYLDVSNDGPKPRTVRTLQELVQQDNEQDLKRNWLYEFYRRKWNRQHPKS